MESRDDKGRQCVKGSINYICGLITDLGVSGLSPEVLRQAKFNRLPKATCLFRALHDLVALHLACFPGGEGKKRMARTGRSSVSPSLRGGIKENRSAAPKVLRRASGQKGVIYTAASREYANVSPSSAHEVGYEKRPREKCGEGPGAVLDDVCKIGEEEDMLAFVKFYMALWGYPAHSPFFTISKDTRESRHLVLALGWLISQCDVIERGLEQRLRPLLAAKASAPLPDMYPPDTCSSPQALAQARDAEAVAHRHVQRVIAASNRVRDAGSRAEVRAEQALMLYGQVQATLKALYALHTCKARRICELQEAQLLMGSSRPLSQYEMHLLAHSDLLEQHLQALEAAKGIAEEMAECEKHEKLFWHWMESVAHEALADQMHTKVVLTHLDPAGVTETEMLPVINFMCRELAESGHSAKDLLGTDEQGIMQGKGVCDSLQVLPAEMVKVLSSAFDRSSQLAGSDSSKNSTAKLTTQQGLLKHAEDNAQGLLQEPVYLYCPAKKPSDFTAEHDGQDWSTANQCSVTGKLKRLTHVAVTLARVLARTRAQNRAVILEALRPILDDESYVFVGL